MEQEYDLSESQSIERYDETVRNLGLTLLKPFRPGMMSDVETELLWQFVQTQEYMFSDFERGNREGFIARLRDPRHLHLDFGGDGLAILLNAWACDTPDLHWCVWNPERSTRDIIKAGEQILQFAFGQMKAQRINGFTPEPYKLPQKIATMMGFKFEGCLRQQFLYFGKRFDVYCYGLLRHEWMQRQERLNAIKQ